MKTFVQDASQAAAIAEPGVLPHEHILADMLQPGQAVEVFQYGVDGNAHTDADVPELFQTVEVLQDIVEMHDQLSADLRDAGRRADRRPFAGAVRTSMVPHRRSRGRGA